MRALALLVAAAALLFGLSRRLLNRPKGVARALIVSPREHTVIEADGAVRSIQAADLILPDEALNRIWSPPYLERLARTYWRFLTQATLGMVRVSYREDGRDVKLFGLFPLLTFQAPEYEMSRERGIVRWRIERGVLVHARGRNGRGYLEIDVQRRPASEPDCGVVHVEVEVANFYPAIAHGLSRWLYENTQSRIHVIVTHGFLRSLARLDLAESRVRRFASVDDLPDPVPARERATEREPSAA